MLFELLVVNGSLIFFSFFSLGGWRCGYFSLLDDYSIGCKETCRKVQFKVSVDFSAGSLS